MGKISWYTFIAIFMISLSACATLEQTPPSATPSGPRTIIVEGETLSEEEEGGFTSWVCKDFIEEDQIVLEVGFVREFDMLGFILYDGGYTGDGALYRRTGLEHRWDWGPDANYSFVIKTDGTGVYYDFSNVSEGESTQPTDIYKCKKR